jgi:hypothetical protein
METPHPSVAEHVLLAMCGFNVRLLPDDDSEVIPRHGVPCANLQELSYLIARLTGKLLTEEELSVRLYPSASGFVYWKTKIGSFAIMPIPKLNYLTNISKN